MPIVGGVTTSVVTIPAMDTTTRRFPGVDSTTTVLLYTTYNASLYSHSTVFVTTEKDASTLANMNAPALTKVFTLKEECANRWMLGGGQQVTRFVPDEIKPIIFNATSTMPGYVRQNLTMFSLNLNGTATDPVYRSCQPYGLAPTYSPGICPLGHTIAEITAYQVSASTGFRTFWQASCCRRYAP
jgi:hypothetical protein